MTKHKIESFHSVMDEMRAVAKGEKPAPKDAGKVSVNSAEAVDIMARTPHRPPEKSEGRKRKPRPSRPMPKQPRAKAMTTKSFDSVWDAIEDTPAAAENMRLRSALMIALTEHMTAQGLSQSQAAKLLGVTQPRVSDFMRGKIGLFDLDTLVSMVAAAGLHIEVKVAKARPKPRG